MKNTIIVTLLFFSVQAYSQINFIGVGYNWGFAKPSGMTTLVERYNSTRILENEMGTFAPDGISLSLQLEMDTWSGDGYIELGYMRQFERNTAIFAAGSNLQQQLRMSMNVGSLGTGSALPLDTEGLAIYYGGRLEVGNVSIYERRTDDTFNGIDWNKIDGGLFLNFTFLMKVQFSFFVIEPYYTVSPDRPMNFLFGEYSYTTNLVEANQELNPSTYQQDGEVIPFNMNGFGIRFLVGIGTTANYVWRD